MPDRDKIIKGLGEILVYCHEQFGKNDHDVQAQLTRMNQTAKDAIELLKAQEPVRPIRVNGRWIKYYACGACKKQLGSNDSRDSYCRHCGRAVKWDGQARTDN